MDYIPRAIIVTLFLVANWSLLKAQDLEWAKSFGGTDVDKAYSVCVDSQGNLYSTGFFRDTVDFDPGPGTNDIVASCPQDMFVQKLDATGNLLWVKTIGGISSASVAGHSITLDDAGNIYTTGTFHSMVDFDPGVGAYNLTAINTNHVFVMKMDTSGGFIWARAFGGDESSNGLAIEVDGLGNVYTTGYFEGTGDFDPGIGTFNVTSVGWKDIFVHKMDASGNFLWAKAFGGTYDEVGRSLTVDTYGNVYTIGDFASYVDFDPGAGFAVYGASGGSNVFVQKLDSSGDFNWVKVFQGFGSDYGRSICIDDFGNLYCTGSFSGTVDFDPGVGVNNITPIGYSDVFVHKMDASGEMLWVKSFGGDNSDFGTSICVDTYGNVHTTGTFGSFGNPVDLDPGYGITNFTSQGSSDVFVHKMDASGNFIGARSFGGTLSDEVESITVDAIGNVYAVGNFEGTSDFNPGQDTLNLTSSGFEDCFVLKLGQKQIVGRVFLDVNVDCNQNADELGLGGRIVQINPGGLYATTNVYGVWALDSLPPDVYTVEVDTGANWAVSCNSGFSFEVDSGGSGFIVAPSIGMFNTLPCSAPEVSVFTPFLRRCFPNQQVYVQACNSLDATDVLYDASVILTLDPLMELEGVSHPYTIGSDSTYHFQIGDLNPGMCMNITAQALVSCDAVLEQTLCMSAEIFPVDSCVYDTIPATIPPDFTPCESPYDKSRIQLYGWCQNDSIFFTIANIGDSVFGDMDCYSPVRLFVDAQYVSLDSIMLEGGSVDTLVFPGDGRTWRLEVDQHPLHPGNSQPSVTVELCGNEQNWTSDLVNTLPHNDADPMVDIYCGIVSGSYDPNDKRGFPTGIGEDNLVSPNGSVDYVIRFQNTGNDTAFVVVIRDTIDQDLDIFSLTSGVSSHDYTFEIHGPRVAEWTFSGIMLPDSTTDEPGSHGFVCFKINQVADLPDHTPLNNTADIYFDYNEPIITNTTSHIVHREAALPHWSEEIELYLTDCDTVVFNSYSYTHSGNYWQVLDGGLESDTLVQLQVSILLDEMNLTIVNTNGTLSAITESASYQWLDCDQNFHTIPGETDATYTPTVDGNYAIQVTHQECTDTSTCFNVTGIGVVEATGLDDVVLFPNPTSGEIHVELNKVNVNVLLRIFNPLGQLIYLTQLNSQQSFSYEITGGNGLYLIQLITPHVSITRKVQKK